MSDINPILNAIDHCLADFTVGGDAMRWSPDAPDPTPVHWSEQSTYARPVSTGPEPVEATGLWIAPIDYAPLGTPTTEQLAQASIRYILARYGSWGVLGSMTPEQAADAIVWRSDVTFP